MVLSPAESGKFIVANAKHLKVHQSGIDKLASEVLKGLRTGEIRIENFSQHNHHPKPTDPHAIDWIFLVDTLNFCFWTPGSSPTKWRVEGETGYFAMCAAINRAIKEGIDITNPVFYSTITLDQLRHIFRGDLDVKDAPLMEQRVRCLHEIGNKLIQKYNGKFENCILESKNSAKKLLNLIVTEFPCFADEADYAGERVSIYKRAQILIGDLWACYRGEGLGKFNDITEITMFADYRVPQVLIHFGALEYNEELLKKLKEDVLLPNGSPEEVEIRGASIYIVQELREKVVSELKTTTADLNLSLINAILLDHFLWDYRRKFANELEYIPFHKTLSVYY